MAEVQLRHGFGLQRSVASSIACVDESTVIYPIGRTVALFNTETRAMSFVSEGGERSENITALALAPSKKYLAVCTGEPQIFVYHVSSQRRLKPLTCAEVTETSYVCAAFSADSKLLAALSGAPDHALVLWLWDKAKLLSFTKLLQPVSAVGFAACSPRRRRRPRRPSSSSPPSIHAQPRRHRPPSLLPLRGR